MQWSAWIGLALGFFAVSTDLGPPPVILDLGPVKPTAAPTPKHVEKRRLVSTITVQNSAKSESVVSFEVMDVGDEGDEKKPLIAAKTYALSDALSSDNPQAKELAYKIVTQVRELERSMLKYAEIMGPPKEREPLTQ